MLAIYTPAARVVAAPITEGWAELTEETVVRAALPGGPEALRAFGS